jgi:hypothetical protein
MFKQLCNFSFRFMLLFLSIQYNFNLNFSYALPNLIIHLLLTNFTVMSKHFSTMWVIKTYPALFALALGPALFYIRMYKYLWRLGRYFGTCCNKSVMINSCETRWDGSQHVLNSSYKWVRFYYSTWFQPISQNNRSWSIRFKTRNTGNWALWWLLFVGLKYLHGRGNIFDFIL